MSDEVGRRWPKVADEGGRLFLRVALLTLLIRFAFPLLPGVRFSGSALVAVMVALPFAVLGRLGHSSVAVSSGDPQNGWVVTESQSMKALTARRGGWIVVGAVWIAGFLVAPSLLLHLLALLPRTHLEFRGWWSTLLPAVLFLLVHVLAVSVRSQKGLDSS